VTFSKENKIPSFKIIAPTKGKVPILISVPHCGILFPDEIKEQYHAQFIGKPDDTDWFVDKLYDFSSEIGITMIQAVYSRLVVDLNRNPEQKPLYNDGRIITELVTKTDFHGNHIYKTIPSQKEIDKRISLYYEPYHNKIDSLLKDFKEEFGHALLFDAHSIRQYVPTIHKDKFPDLILGDADETAADKHLIETTLNNLSSSDYSLSHNTPFKGGYITRSFGKPKSGIHALQLEMTKINYMDDLEKNYDTFRADKMRVLLKKTFHSLIKTLDNEGI